MGYLPYNKNLVSRAKALRKNMTLAEKKIWYDYLRHFRYRVYRQRPIDNFIVDFYCPKLKLVIETDGNHHYTDRARASDRARTEILQGYGLSVIRFSNQEVLDNFTGVVLSIEGLIAASPE